MPQLLPRLAMRDGCNLISNLSSRTFSLQLDPAGNESLPHTDPQHNIKQKDGERQSGRLMASSNQMEQPWNKANTITMGVLPASPKSIPPWAFAQRVSSAWNAVLICPSWSRSEGMLQSCLQLEPVVALVALPEPCDPASQHCPLHLTLHPLPSPHSPANTFGAEIICLIHSVTHPPSASNTEWAHSRCSNNVRSKLNLVWCCGGGECSFPGSSVVRNLPATAGEWGFDQEDALEQEMTTHSSILPRIIPWTEEPGGLYIVHEVAKSWTQLSTHTIWWEAFPSSWDFLQP